jgi:hypothetical protein
MSASFVVYVDESGDEGFSFGQGSSEWFVISAVITRKAKDLDTVKLVDSVRARLKKPDKKPLHFRDLRHEHRLVFVDAISKAALKTVTVLAHKPSLKEPEKFQERYRLYFCSVRFLLERVSWFCRDHRLAHDPGDGTAEIVFSNRSGMSYDDLRQYMSTLKLQSQVQDVRIDWSIIKPDEFTAFTAGKRMGLQIADALASSFFYAVQSSQYGFVEGRYARMLKPVVYHREGRHLGYGLKFWPREADTVWRNDKRLDWLEAFNKTSAGSGTQDPTH